MRILILGATGMLGHRLFWGLDSLGYNVLGGMRELDLSQDPFCHWPIFRNKDKLVTGLDGYDFLRLRERLKSIHPDVIINCIGVIKQRDEGKSSVPCIALNALLPHVLNEVVSEWNGWLINFSTDCVFKGDRGHYTEDDDSDVEDWYGRTKSMGEVRGPHALTLRTSIIGRELRGHKSLIDWFISNNGGSVKGFSNAIYSGITTHEMVNVIHLLLSVHTNLRGLYHVASEPINKFDLLCLVRQYMGLNVNIVRDEMVVVNRSLKFENFHQATGYLAPSWKEMIASMVVDNKMYRVN